ncbi:MAG: hypothetical protein GY938_18595, partial [Ketobacter sp.]|nr:hypothetical protein [Ketobacter sp.]
MPPLLLRAFTPASGFVSPDVRAELPDFRLVHSLAGLGFVLLARAEHAVAGLELPACLGDPPIQALLSLQSLLDAEKEGRALIRYHTCPAANPLGRQIARGGAQSMARWLRDLLYGHRYHYLDIVNC